MTRRLPEFTGNVQRCRDLVGLGQRLSFLTGGLVDPTDIYRAALSQSVSALDHYVHGVVLDRGVEILMGRMAPTPPSRVAPMPQSSVGAILAEPVATREITVRAHLATALSKETFQTADDVGKALAAVGVKKIWSAAFGTSAQAMTTQLGIVVGRRNRIVHQCDTDPLNPGTSVPLTDTDALDAVRFIESIVMAIDPLL